MFATTPRLTRTHALLAVGLLLIVAPAFAPLQPVLEHDTRMGSFQNESSLEDEGYRIVEYENLSERGKQLYVETLRNGGTYRVALGEGASDFGYPTEAEVDSQEGYEARIELSQVVIERPENASLPPADEDVEHGAEVLRERAAERKEDEGATTAREGARTTRSEAERRRQVARYDVMQTRTTKPGPTSQPALFRFGTAMVGVVLTGTGGYLSSKP